MHMLPGLAWPRLRDSYTLRTLTLTLLNWTGSYEFICLVIKTKGIRSLLPRITYHF